MVFISKFIFEEQFNLMNCVTIDPSFERIAIIDTKNKINIFLNSDIHTYFESYRKRFNETNQFSHISLKKPSKITEIYENKISSIMMTKFSSKKFLVETEEIRTFNEKNNEIPQIPSIIQTSKGKIINLITLKNQNKNKKVDKNSYLLATGLENGAIDIYALKSINIFHENLTEISQNDIENKKYSETWTLKYKLFNKNLLAVVDLEWSPNSDFLIALYYNQEILIWGFENPCLELNKLSPMKIIHKISLQNIEIKSILSDKSMNFFFVISNENVFGISYSKENFTINKYLENSIEKKNEKFCKDIEFNDSLKNREEMKEFDESGDLSLFGNGNLNFISSLNISSNCLIVPHQEPNFNDSNLKKFGIDKAHGFYFYKFSEDKKEISNIQIIQVYLKNQVKINCCVFSSYLFTNFMKKKLETQSNLVGDTYSLVASVFENQITIYKFYEKNKINKKKINTFNLILKIVDFKYNLNDCLWVDPYTLLVNDDIGKMWYVKFTCAELGFVLTAD